MNENLRKFFGSKKLSKWTFQYAEKTSQSLPLTEK